jgi:purine nucleoside phosphorylase
MSAPYDAAMNKPKEIAKQNDTPLHEGVYASVAGPHLKPEQNTA